MEKIITYIRESVGELKKVTWPTKKQTLNYSILVIGISLGTSLFFMLLDYALNEGITALIK